MTPFSEYARFEQSNSDDDFYASGSAGSIGNYPGTFSGNLLGKDQIQLSFQVKRSIQMLPNSSSIYYFNFENNQWNVPTGSVPDHIGPFQNFSVKFGSGTWPSGEEKSGTRGTRVLEDQKGFDYMGRASLSGSLNVYRWENTGSSNSSYNQTSTVIGKTIYQGKDVVPFLIENYPKSIQRSDAYKPSKNEVISLKLDRPFLIEKAVIELPISAGSTWFQDRTITSLSYATGTYNGSTSDPFYRQYYYGSGGPCLTVTLMCQKKYGIGSLRELIASGTITHKDDPSGLIARVPQESKFSNFPYMFIETCGVKSPTFSIQKNSSSQFTGSVALKMTAAVSNGACGVNAMFNYLTGSSRKTADRSDFTVNEFLSETLKRMESPYVSGDFTKFQGVPGFDGTEVTSLDPFGRGMSGFSPSGASVFGGEFVTPQFDIFSAGTTYANPVYVADDTIRTQMINQISSTLAEALVGVTTPYTSNLNPFAAVISFYDTSLFSAGKDSPYLVNPGDELLLTISKTRPAVSMSYHDITAGSLQYGASKMLYYKNVIGDQSGHDVCLMTGTINITLYGSYVRGGNNYTP